jgi:CHAD domain-containing protein
MNEAIENKSIAIYRFLEEQLELYKDLLQRISSSMDEETIHRLRVSVKKIRTIQKLKKHIHFPSVINKTQIKAIKEIFAISGQMRDLQIQQNLLAGYSSTIKSPFSQLTEYLNTRQEIIKNELSEKIKGTDFSEFPEITDAVSNDNVENLPDIEKESIIFLEVKINNISRLIFTLDKDNHVHDLRKELKQMFFILQFLKNQFEENGFKNYPIKNLRRITERIGHWNDRDVFDGMLHNFIETQHEHFLIENPEYTILEYFIRTEKKDLLRGIEIDVYLELIMLKVLIQKTNKIFGSKIK